MRIHPVRTLREFRYDRDKLQEAIASIWLSIRGSVHDSRGQSLALEDTPRILCQEQDGRGLSASNYDELNPCMYTGPPPLITRMKRTHIPDSPYMVLLEAGEKNLWISAAFLDKQAGQLT